MKKSLLFLFGVVGFVSTATAQSLDAPARSEEAKQAVKAPFEAIQTEQNETFVAGPMRSVANGLWYKRPEGTFLNTSSSLRLAVVPPFTKLTWTSMYTGSDAIWAWGDAAQNPYSESQIKDNNLETTYSMGSYFGPFLYVENVDTFGIVDSQLSSGYPIVVAIDSIYTFTHVPTTKMYTGFSNFSYGFNPPISADRDGTADTYSYSRFFEYFHAPAQPLYLEGITLSVSMTEGHTVPVDEGSEGVTCYVVQAGEDAVIGNPTTYTDTVAVIPINPYDAEFSEYREGYYTSVKAYCMKVDDFGGMMAEPAVIDKDFVLIFDGFNREGVHFYLSMSAVPVEEQYHNGGGYPTVYHAFWNSDGTRRGSYWQYSSSSNTQYNMVVRLNAMFDVATVYDSNRSMTAPTEGGLIYSVGTNSEGEEVNYAGVYLQSVFPYQSEMSPEPSYQVEDMPEWLSVYNFIDDYYTKENGWVTIVNFEAQPLPEGVNGRMARIHFTSRMGAKSKVFTVIQGDAVDGIETITAESKQGTAVYNLAGQRVDENYRGVVIVGGKKLIRK